MTKAELIAEIERKQAEIKALRKKLDALEYDERISRSKSYETRKQLLEQAAPIFASYVNLGDFVRVTGAKSRPIRKVKEINEHYVIGSACNQNKRGEITVNEYDIRQCGTDKITAWLFGDKWVTAKQVVEHNRLIMEFEEDGGWKI